MSHDPENTGSAIPDLSAIFCEISRICQRVAPGSTESHAAEDRGRGETEAPRKMALTSVANVDGVVRQRSIRSYVTISTSSGIDAIQIAIGMKKRMTPFKVVPIFTKPESKPLFDLRADPLDGPDVFDTMRSLLTTLSLAAERGALKDFEVVHGIYLLQGPGA